MADLTITAANVLSGSGARIVHGKAGAAVTAGQTVYQDPADQRFKLADCDNASAAVRALSGIALNGAANGQPLAVQFDGEIALGAVLTAGATYYLSPNPGGIAPLADLGSGDFPTVIGLAESTSVLRLGITAAGAALA
jgi:hypothetical protein